MNGSYTVRVCVCVCVCVFDKSASSPLKPNHLETALLPPLLTRTQHNNHHPHNRRRWPPSLFSLPHTPSSQHQPYPLSPPQHSSTNQPQEKVVLLSLMNLVFATPAHERTLPFAAIAERGRIAVEQVRCTCVCIHSRQTNVNLGRKELVIAPFLVRSSVQLPPSNLDDVSCKDPLFSFLTRSHLCTQHPPALPHSSLDPTHQTTRWSGC